MSLIHYINTLTLPFRGDCPICFNKNTFVASSTAGQILYYCFHSDCKLRGKINDTLSIDVLRNPKFELRLNDIISSGHDRRESSLQLPEYFVSPLQNRACRNLFDRYNLYQYFDRHVDRIRYDPKQNRCVFILKDYDDVIKGYTGRRLNYDASPRWYVYERLVGCPFIPLLQSLSKSAILVEDCISAIRASSICNCIAVLGTNITDGCILYLKRFSRLYIALDDDATRKSIKLQKQLSYYIPTEIIPLRRDLKYFTDIELQELKIKYDF